MFCSGCQDSGEKSPLETGGHLLRQGVEKVRHGMAREEMEGFSLESRNALFKVFKAFESLLCVRSN